MSNKVIHEELDVNNWFYGKNIIEIQGYFSKFIKKGNYWNDSLFISDNGDIKLCYDRYETEEERQIKLRIELLYNIKKDVEVRIEGEKKAHTVRMSAHQDYLNKIMNELNALLQKK